MEGLGTTIRTLLLAANANIYSPRQVIRMPIQQLLFYGTSIHAVMEFQKEALRGAVARLTESDFQVGEDTVQQRLVAEYNLRVPRLREDAVYATKEEVDVDVRGDPNRLFFDRTEPFYVRATEVTIHIPFDGEASLFRVQPETFNLNPPRGSVRENELQLTFTIIDGNDNVKAQFSSVLDDVKTHLDWMKSSAFKLGEELQQIASAALVQRRQRLAAHASAIGALGIPLRQPELPRSSAAIHVTEKPSRRSRSDTKWDVFISHATEDKQEIARPLAEALRAKGLAVWYDEFSLTVGDSLRESIDRGLAGSRYGVVILSEHFFEKHWPVKELNGLAARAVNRSKVILPVWHKVGFEDVRRLSPMLADMVAVPTDKGLDFVVQQILAAVT
jgi:hypothetical protein